MLREQLVHAAETGVVVVVVVREVALMTNTGATLAVDIPARNVPSMIWGLAYGVLVRSLTQ